jgi:hypothetical protein
MSKNRKFDIAALFCDFLIIILEFIALNIVVADMGLPAFVYYTQLSNAFLLISTIIYAYFLLRRINGGKHKIPRAVELMKYSATICTALTFIVCVTLLSWMTGYGLKAILTQGAMLELHTLCPILAVASFVFLEKYNIQRGREIWIGIAPTLLYAAVAIALNIARVLVGPYPFLMVYAQPIYMSVIWCGSILFVTYGIALALRAADRAMRKPKHKKHQNTP